MIKSVFKFMWFIAKACWFILVFAILYAVVEYMVDKLVAKFRKKKEDEDTVEKALSDEGLNSFEHNQEEPAGCQSRNPS